MGILEEHIDEACQLTYIFMANPASRPEDKLSDLAALAEILYELKAIGDAAERAEVAFDMAMQ